MLIDIDIDIDIPSWPLFAPKPAQAPGFSSFGK
jgi:hypothetical protein